MAFGGRLLKRTFDQGLPDALLAKCWLNRHRAEQQRFRLADANGRKPHRADQQSPDPGREGQFANVIGVLPLFAGLLGLLLLLGSLAGTWVREGR